MRRLVEHSRAATLMFCATMLLLAESSAFAQFDPFQTGGQQTPPANSSGSGRLRFLPPSNATGQGTTQGEAGANVQQGTNQQAATQQVDATAAGNSTGNNAQTNLQFGGASTHSTRAAIGTYRLRGVVAGETTFDAVMAQWGDPARQTETGPQTFTAEYAFPQFAGAALSIAGGKVARIVLPLESPKSAGEIVSILGLNEIPHVIVPDEEGRALGIAFPERGVLFSLTSAATPEVTQVTIEPVSFHAFLLRAEATWRTNYTTALADLDTVLEFDPNQPQAHWIRAQVLLALGRSDEALAAIREASRLAPETPEYMLTEANILIHQGHAQLAKELANQAVRTSDQLPELKAQAMVLQGNLLRDESLQGGHQAMDLHMQAIEAAKLMINEPRAAIRRAARDAYLDAHLAVAEDIATGAWRNQTEAVSQWLSRGMSLAEGAEEKSRGEQQFRVACQALHVLARIGTPPDPEDWAKQTLTFGRELLANCDDPLRQQHLSWQLAAALSSGVKIHRQRGEAADAMQLAQLADKYFEEAGPDRGRGGREALQLGLFRFQAGSVEALLSSDHKAAAAWFEKSRANFAQTPKHLTERMDAEYGQILVSMAVTYWELGQTEPAVQLMGEGAMFMEAAVRGGRLDSKALGAPYYNLAAMNRYLGREQEATRFDELARSVGVDTAVR